MRFIAFVAILIGLGAMITYANFGTVEPCGILRARLRNNAAHDSQFAGFVANAMPDSVLNAIAAARYGPLTPAKCVAVLLGANRQSSEAPAGMTGDNPPGRTQ